MRVRFGEGLVLTLGLKDKETGEREKRLKCQLNEWKNAKVTLHIVKQVNARGFLEEPGFHIAVGSGDKNHTGPEYRTSYQIWLSEERFRDLTNPAEGNPIIHGGHFVSRCLYDRLEIMYFAV